VAHRERLTTLRKSYARINAGYAVVEVMDAIPSDDVADEDIFELLTRVLLTLDDETYDPMLVPSSFYFKLLALTDRVRSSTSASTADVTCPWSRSTRGRGTLCADCRSGTSISPNALQLIRRIMSGDLAAVLRESRRRCREVMAIALDSIESHLASNCARRARRRRSRADRPGNVARR